MNPGTYVTQNVPNDQLPSVIASYPSNATITTIPEPDGEWTVIAVIPDAIVSAAARRTTRRRRRVE